MRKKGVIIGSVVLAVLCLATLPVFSQEMEQLAPEALKPFQRPPSVFTHDAHNEKAEIVDCIVCHHYGEDGKKIEDMTSEGIPCSDCHMVEPEDDTTPLRKAYHKQCKDCHLEEKKGPITCGECHVRE